MAYPISDVPRRIVYSGSAGVGPYAFTFEVLANTDIAVYKNTTLLTLTTDYTVSINTGTGTGTVTLVVAATGSDTVTIVGDRAIQRTSDFVTGGDLFANTLNDELDAQTIYAQQVDEKADRAIRAPVTDATTINMVLPAQATRAGKALGFNASGNPTQSASTLAAIDATVTTVQTLAAASPGSSAGISHIAAGSGALATTVQAKLRETVSVLDFVPSAEHAAIVNGTSTYDISDAIRLAIDALGPNGGVVDFPNGGAGVVGSTVYIPPKGYGVTLQGNKFAISGGGVGTHAIFETGMPGNSFGGSSNWSAPNETVLSQGLIIRDFVFLECGTAIKVFNAIWRSEFSGNWAYQNVTTLLHAKRCFYSKTLFNHAVIGRAGRGANDPCYWFEEAVNVQTIVGNSASGIYGGSNKSGAGYLFTGGMSGLSFSNNSAEACITGLKITGEITGAEIVGCYFELDTVGIDLGLAGKTVDIGGCFFFSNVTTAITCAGGWVAGRLRADNSIDAACLVDLSAASNIMVVELAPQQFDMTTAYTNYYNVPANWTIGAGARILRPAAVYDAGTGVAAQRALLTQETNSGGLTPLPYAGDIGPTMGANLPFGYTVIISGTSVYADTEITYRDTACAAFTLIITDNASSQVKVAGFVRFGTSVFRLDSETCTVTASNASGKLRLVFSGFANNPIASINDIRVWIG